MSLLHRSLSFKILAILCLFLTSLVGSAAVMGYLTASSVIDHRLEYRGTTMALVLSYAVSTIYDGAHELDPQSRILLQRIADHATVEQSVRGVSIVDANGHVLAQSDPDGRAAPTSPSQVAEAMAARTPMTYRTADRRRFTIVTPLTAMSQDGPGLPYGAMSFTFDFSDVTEALEAGTLWRVLMAIAVAAAICVAVFYALLRLVVRPTRDLAAQAARLGEGDLTARSHSRRANPEGDEIQRLEHAFNRMAQRLQRTQDERAAVTAALMESQHLFEQFMNNSPAIAFMKNEHGYYVYVNATFCSALGFQQGEIIGKRDSEVWPDDFAGQATDNDQTVMRANTTMEFVETYPHADGMHEWFTFKFPIASAGGRLIAGIAIDITAHKRAEAMLQLSEQRFRALIENSSDMVVVVSSDGRIAYVSPSAQRILGHAPETLVGALGISLVHREDRATNRQTFHLLAQCDHSSGRFELRLRHRDRTWRTLEVVGHNLVNDPSVKGIVFNSRDVTERKAQEEERRKLEAQMQHAQKLESLGVLAGGIAHDFNNLLMGVLGNAGMALMELDPGSVTYEKVKLIETAALRAADLTRQMLAYSGKGKFTVQPVNLSRLVEEMSHLLRAAISKNATLRYEFDGRLPAVEADATQLRQVAMNLITNASDALGDQEGVITVSTYTRQLTEEEWTRAGDERRLAPGEYAVLEVRDTGVGMDEQTVRRIYEPFFTTKFTGRGLGLAAVQGIVRSHHGAIRVLSAPGQGASFQVLLPATRLAVAETVEPQETERWTTWRGHGAVLVVDDEAVVRSMVRSILEHCGLTVLDAEDGREGLALYQRHRQDIVAIVLDMTMPCMNGEEAYRELRRINPNARIILSSGYSEQEALAKFTGAGLAGFIQKPYKPGALIEKVRTTLQQS